MEVTVNGAARELANGTRLVALIESMGMDQRFLVVEYNGEPLRRDQFDGQQLEHGDRLEFVRPVAGG